MENEESTFEALENEALQYAEIVRGDVLSIAMKSESAAVAKILSNDGRVYKKTFEVSAK